MNFISVLLEGLKKKDTTSHDMLEKNRVRSTIENMCDSRLKNSDDILTFEALPSAINDVILVLEEPELATKYDCMQVDETLFEIKLKELEI